MAHSPGQPPTRRSRRRALRWRHLPSRTSGQALVEFAFASTFFLSIVFGTIDFGRVIFSYAQLHNAVREGARYAKVHCPDTDAEKNAVRDVVIDHTPNLSLNLDPDKFIVETNPEELANPCIPPDEWVRVKAEAEFTAVTQTFLGIEPITFTSSARVDVE